MKRTLNPRREILFELLDVARALRTYVDQRAREHGMTRAQWAVLARLERDEGMMQTEMAEALEIQPISLVRLVDRLCEQGLVERRPHPTDRRANCLYLTDAGRDRLIEMVPLAREISANVLAGFSEQDVAELLRRLVSLKGNIRSAAARRGALVGGSEVRHAR
ncbi:MAG TPA: MarR family transcriptional regulator [Hyphomicrobiaceae bacterium]|jgi:MarR family transcriptional regulator for hemolysin|nr:MarR family transcriptional regulator [Hyphomicrobiaceae bacterium]